MKTFQSVQNIHSIVAAKGYRSPWKRHKNRWLTCKDCGLGALARRHCLLRCYPPAIPFEVLFVGEAPGPSENDLGTPFIGPAGKVQQALIDASIDVVGEYSYGLSNVLGCRPYDPDSGRNFRLPSSEEIEACTPRIMELYKLLRKNLKLVVLLGVYAQESPFGKFVQEDQTDSIGTTVLHCWHPSYINRTGGIQSYNFCLTLDKLTRVLSQVLEANHVTQKNYRKKRLRADKSSHRKSTGSKTHQNRKSKTHL